jgi:DNA (cytosine-5)-methyltransferase 3A
MKKESELIISKYVNTNPIEINSELVSAQNRVRLYWTNINQQPYGMFGDMMANIPNPKDKGILLKDIFETDYNIIKKYKVPKTKSREQMWAGKCKNVTNERKSSCLVTKQDRWNSQGLIEFEDFCRFFTPIENERLQTVPDNYTNHVSDKERDRMLGNGWTVDVIAHILSFIN